MGIGIGIGMRKEEGVRGFEKREKEKGKRKERKKKNNDSNSKFHVFINTYSLTRALHKTTLPALIVYARSTCSCCNR